MNFPDAFKKNIAVTWGRKGQLWLNQIESTLKVLSRTWNLYELVPLPQMSYSFVAQAQHPQYGPVVLKLVYSQKDFENEVTTLQAYAGSGSVLLYDVDSDHKALLLELLQPGRSAETLFPHKDEDATHHLITIMKHLKEAPCGDSTRSLSEWFKPLFDHTHTEISSEHYKQARGLAEELLSFNYNTLAHGDLHHGNIIESQRGWVSIDPKGVCAPFGFDVGAFMYNPLSLLHEKDCVSIVGRRFDQSAHELNLDRKFLVRMSYCQAMLATCWALDDGTHAESFYRCAELMRKYYP